MYHDVPGLVWIVTAALLYTSVDFFAIITHAYLPRTLASVAYNSAPPSSKETVFVK